jgi:hypothetical protein
MGFMPVTITPYLLTPCNRVLEKLTGSQSRNSPHFMEPDSSFTHLQVPATCLYPEPRQSSPRPPSHFLKFHLNIILPPLPGYASIRYELKRSKRQQSSFWFQSFCLINKTGFPLQKFKRCADPVTITVSPAKPHVDVVSRYFRS